jgi:GxxExxY protein
MFNDVAGHEDLTDKIIECGIKGHEHFGPGLLESVYKACLALELREAGLHVDTTRRVALVYKTHDLETFFCPDIVVNDAVIVELKTVDMVTSVHVAQVITYLKLTNLPVGLLMNFNVALLNRGVRRIVRPDLSRPSSSKQPT